MDQDEDWKGLCSFLRRSRYDVVQPYAERQWGLAWTFVGSDLHAAEKAAWQMKRMGVKKLRHACRARVRIATGEIVDVALVTTFPGHSQTVLHLQTAEVVPDVPLLMDDAILALDGAIVS